MKDADSHSIVRESVHQDHTHKLRALFCLDPQEPKEKKGVEAIETIVGIGLFCTMGLSLNEQQCQFLARLGGALADKLSTPGVSAADAVVDILGLDHRRDGGGPGHNWRRLQRDRVALHTFLNILLSEPQIASEDPIKTVAEQMKLHPDTVRAAVRRLGSAELARWRRRGRGRPPKFPKGRR
jgi:hypothetical protein